MIVRLVSTQPAVYLAGPLVFAPDASAWGAHLKSECERNGLLGLWPLDSEKASAVEIYTSNLRMLDRAAAVIADLSPFRGPHMDIGTAFEIGYAAGDRDEDGMLIEDFDLVEILMIGCRPARSTPRSRRPSKRQLQF